VPEWANLRTNELPEPPKEPTVFDKIQADWDAERSRSEAVAEDWTDAATGIKLYKLNKQEELIIVGETTKGLIDMALGGNVFDVLGGAKDAVGGMGKMWEFKRDHDIHVDSMMPSSKDTYVPADNWRDRGK